MPASDPGFRFVSAGLCYCGAQQNSGPAPRLVRWLFLTVDRCFKNDKAKPGEENEKRGNRYPLHYKSSSSLMRA
jgi:hypothetical protein